MAGSDTKGARGSVPAASVRQIDGVPLNDVAPPRHSGRWIALILLLVLAGQMAVAVAGNPNFHWHVFAEYLFHRNVLRGVLWTLGLTVAAMSVAVVLAIALVVMRDSDNPILRGLSWLWVWFFRGTPIYTQLLFWGLFAVLFPVLSLSIPFGPELLTIETKRVITAMTAAILGLAFNESAYLTEIFRAGFRAIDRGQTEAAQAIGIPKAKIWARILLPQAMRTIIPPTGNETIGMLKMTSLVLAIPFTLDLMFATNAIANRLYLPVPLLMVAGFWYLVITSVLMVGQHYLERHFGKGHDAGAGQRA
ncbi:amino acid ABC transporter permease [Frigidibacter sp. ROC022]|uniref:amino acid ABC transporter permease n=1 Tax=Frigidibacter sp. ROC022 TaxID=2971796 RepID=UPI00215AA685|nr:amino acid ABC transporter permease [Frigidibacter sp. ROC022]MCR8723717.1 amino acid ABC transporter permease [Frigidibacter sp. ROC022]